MRTIAYIHRLRITRLNEQKNDAFNEIMQQIAVHEICFLLTRTDLRRPTANSRLHCVVPFHVGSMNFASEKLFHLISNP